MNKYLKHSIFWIAVSLVFASVGFAQIKLPAEAYFWTLPQVVETIVDVKVFDKFVETPILDEEGEPTGETWQRPTYKTVPESSFHTELCGERPLNWRVCGEYGGKKIISVFINTGESVEMAMRLKEHDDYLATPKQIWQAAKDGNAKAILVCKNAMYLQWWKVDAEGNTYAHFGTIQQWIDEGRPPRCPGEEGKFRPYQRWFVDPEVAGEDEF